MVVYVMVITIILFRVRKQKCCSKNQIPDKLHFNLWVKRKIIIQRVIMFGFIQLCINRNIKIC